MGDKLEDGGHFKRQKNPQNIRKGNQFPNSSPKQAAIYTVYLLKFPRNKNAL